jgi:hypothetical protein
MDLGQLSSLCYCRTLHQDCSPSTCPQARYSRNTGEHEIAYLRDWKASAGKGCQTCAVIVNGLSIPRIQRGYQSLIMRRGNDGRKHPVKELDDVGVDVMLNEKAGSERVVVMVSDSSDMYFNVQADSLEG